MTRTPKSPVVERSFRFRPGWIIRDCSNASGGVRYERTLVDEQVRGNGMVTDHETRKTVDNVEFCALLDALVKKVDYVLRKHCTRTEMGWFADDQRWKLVKQEVAVLKAEAEFLNTIGAKRAQSARRAKIAVAPLRLDLACPEAVQEIASTVHDVLSEMLYALRTGDIGSMHKLKIRALNLEQLATGIQSDIIRFAVERAHEATREIKKAIRGAHNSQVAAQRVARSLDLEVIEAAIVHFRPAEVRQSSVHNHSEVA